MNTMQKAFDRMAAHLLHMKDRSVDDIGFCTYRGENDSCCAVGVLINDEHYQEEILEGDGPLDFYVAAAIEKSGWGISNTEIELYCRMQQIHDKKCNSSTGEDGTVFMKLPLSIKLQKLNEVASEYRLKPVTELPEPLTGMTY